MRLDRLARRALAAALEETPQTFGAISCLRRDLCEAFATGSSPPYGAVVVQHRADAGEPMGHGADPHLLWGLLEPLRGWYAVSVAASVARPLGALIEGRLRTPVRYLEDVYHVLDRPAPFVHHPAVRRMTPADLALLRSAPSQLETTGLGDAETTLREGVVACAVVDGVVVARAYTAALSTRYADIAVDTLPKWRGRGFAFAAATLVAREVQEGGRVPVWSAGEHKRASLRVAEKLGFVAVSRRTYVVREDRTPA